MVGALTSATSKAERTRLALRDAAIKRFVLEGFDATSVADIAADVSVSERTFYRYFSTKEEVLFSDYELRLEWFRRALEVRPRGEPIVTSVMTATESFPGEPAVLAELARLRDRDLGAGRIEWHLHRLQARYASTIENHLLPAEPTVDERLTARIRSLMIGSAVFSALDIWMRTAAGDLAELRRLTELGLRTAADGL
ncbi:TetR family transcriptional regulator [Mycolicibacterium aichiense]|nr:TetR family transcriptional regulator [Mycolicibacterium aichiense]MCV7017522.1 TetR family transcriptional regulator [Mycolicibacterium aichiense]